MHSRKLRPILIPKEERIMPITADLTIRETAALSGVSKAMIEKAVEARILPTVAAPAHFRGGATRYLPVRAVAYFRSLSAANLTDLSVRHKRAIWTCLAKLEPMRLQSIEFTTGAMIDLERLAAETLRIAEQYLEVRDQYIASDPDILGSTPVIAGTRLTVYSVLGRLQDGDSTDDLAKDYPELPREAFRAAELYAKSHPLRGRPSGRPWRNVT